MFNLVNILAVLACMVISYLLGSVNSAIIVSKLYAKEDIRNYGSGNAGMTNILRTYGKLPALFTFLGDFSKGAVAVLVSRLIFWLLHIDLFDIGFLAGFCVLIGHLFPIFFGFRGGKGILVSLGIIVVINPVVFLIIAVLAIPFVFIVKIVSLASILGAILFPIITYLVGLWQGRPVGLEILFACLISAIIIFMHRANIKRLLNGTEPRFGQKKPEDDGEAKQ